jgi:hypothetical protein
LLKNSVFTDGLIFAEAPVRLSENYLGDLIINPQFDERLSLADCGAFDCEEACSNYAERKIVVISTSTFSTISATTGLMHRSKTIR